MPEAKICAAALRTLSVAVCLGGIAAPALSANHALILTIDYAGTRAELKGIDLDAENARNIALAMGVPPGNIMQVRNQSLTLEGFHAALRGLNDRIQPGDKVFIYYSGHGSQIQGSGNNKCSEGMLSARGELFSDTNLKQVVGQLASRASQVVMFNDSCFSGGAITSKGAAMRSLPGFTPKYYEGNIETRAEASGYRCGEPVNKQFRNLVVEGSRQGANVVYVAASADNEVSFATEQGSTATNAWVACLKAADADRSGVITAGELKNCAQQLLRRQPMQQTITVIGNENLPLAFAAGTTSGAGAGQAGRERVDPVATLRNLASGATPGFAVDLQLARSRMRIGVDPLDFSVSSNREGYLYVFQAGSDGKLFNLLFPNRINDNNYIKAGSYSLPHPDWRIRAGGPAGASHLLAIVTRTRLNLNKEMDINPQEAFSHLDADLHGAKVLFVEATNGSSGGGGYGASQVVRVEEVQ
ncbi:MAG: caspase family protein [Rhodocyclaceae bacterium]|nr:caspase family protein [Rhodocyclaceae bacterium]